MAIEVLVMLEIKNLKNRSSFEKLVKKEGFEIIQDEEFAYKGNSTTTLFATKAYILDVFKTALQKNSFDSCSLIFLLNEKAYPIFQYDKKLDEFIEMKS